MRLTRLTFHQGGLLKKTITSSSKVLGVMINTIAVTIDSVIQSLVEFVSMPNITAKYRRYYLLCT